MYQISKYIAFLYACFFLLLFYCGDIADIILAINTSRDSIIIFSEQLALNLPKILVIVNDTCKS